jgi:hypothetical protein
LPTDAEFRKAALAKVGQLGVGGRHYYVPADDRGYDQRYLVNR